MTTDYSSEIPSPTALASGPVVVVGGGIAGLVAATRIGQRGVPVMLVDKTAQVGGRAVTRNRDGFLFNLGPHALYRRGRLQTTLQQLGVSTHGAPPPASGGFALFDGKLHTLPVGFASLLGTGLLTLAGKLELARLLAMLPKANAAAVREQTLASWLEARLADPRARAVVEMLVRVTTFTHDAARQSAGAAIEQLQLALRGNVLYLDGGWQTIVDGLRDVAVRAGVRVLVGASAMAVDRHSGAIAVRLADGTSIPAAAAVLAVPPAEVDRLTGVSRFADGLSPVRLATLDVGLRRLPNPKALVAFGVDEPLYFSVHSAAARLAPAGGALIHASMYLAPGQEPGLDVERRLESLLDQLQSGWRSEVASKHYVPNLVVTHAELLASTAGERPSPRVDWCSNIFIAGDWVGARGQLSDGAAASGEEAAELAVAAASGRAHRTAGRDGAIAVEVA